MLCDAALVMYIKCNYLFYENRILWPKVTKPKV